MSPTSYQAAPPRRNMIAHNLGFFANAVLLHFRANCPTSRPRPKRKGPEEIPARKTIAAKHRIRFPTAILRATCGACGHQFSGKGSTQVSDYLPIVCQPDRPIRHEPILVFGKEWAAPSSAHQRAVLSHNLFGKRTLVRISFRSSAGRISSLCESPTLTTATVVESASIRRKTRLVKRSACAQLQVSEAAGAGRGSNKLEDAHLG